MTTWNSKVTCDECGEEEIGSSEEGVDDLVERLESEGWNDTGDRQTCPDCSEE